MSGGNPENWDRMVGARVPEEMRQAIIALTVPLGGVESAKLSVVVRELLRIALAAVTPAFVARATVIAQRRGWDRATTWSNIVRVGLDVIEQGDELRGGDVVVEPQEADHG